jgi:quercetin dioxygenase-like cupin family protein
MNYPDGTPRITVSKITVAHGARIPMHCHPSPMSAYVSSGAIEVIKPSGENQTFNAGEAFVEVSETWHRGYGAGEETELIVFYAGSEEQPLSVGPDGDPDLAAQCK